MRKGGLMSLVEDYHYAVFDANDMVHGYFKTEGLAYQYLQEEYPQKPTRVKKNSKRRYGQPNGDLMPMAFYIRRLKKKNK